MIKVKNELIMSGNFQKAMGGLAMQKLPVKTAFDLKVMMNRIDIVIKNSNGVKNDIFKQYCELDEKGELVPMMETIESKNGEKIEAPVPNSIKPIDATKEEFEKKFIEWKDTEHEIKGSKLTAESLGNVSLSAYDITLLESLMDLGESTPLTLV